MNYGRKYTIKEMEKIKTRLLHFLSIEGLYKSMGLMKRNSVSPQFTDHCFSGDYPTELTDKMKVYFLHSYHYLVIINLFFIKWIF